MSGTENVVKRYDEIIISVCPGCGEPYPKGKMIDGHFHPVLGGQCSGSFQDPEEIRVSPRMQEMANLWSR